MNSHPRRSRTNRSLTPYLYEAWKIIIHAHGDPAAKGALWLAHIEVPREDFADALATAEYWGRHPDYGPNVTIQPIKYIPGTRSERRIGASVKPIYTGKRLHASILEMRFPQSEFPRGNVRPLDWNG